jgi:hypothetical protein
MQSAERRSETLSNLLMQGWTNDRSQLRSRQLFSMRLNPEQNGVQVREAACSVRMWQQPVKDAGSSLADGTALGPSPVARRCRLHEDRTSDNARDATAVPGYTIQQDRCALATYLG